MNSHDDSDVVIVAAKRTPLGNLMGGLSTLTASELGAISHKAALKEAGLDGSLIDEVITGCVLQAGMGQAPARQAARFASIPDTVGATTINKMCGSGLKSVMFGYDLIKAQSATTVLAGGIESMSNTPYLISKARQGYRLGHGELKDSMFLDGLEDAYEHKLMGVYADLTAKKYQFSREQQDEFAKSSMQKALNTQATQGFEAEICPVTLSTRKGEVIIDKDEGPDKAKLDKISRLKPAFNKTDGTVTAANSSTISDGAASLLLTTYANAREKNLNVLAKIHAHSTFAAEPACFTTAPGPAISSLFDKTGWSKENISLFEINEAFAVVTMAAIQDLNLDTAKVNIKGGACALGHPIGASGARILVTLCHALKSGEKGIASLCIGGGEAVAMAVERL
jgi:acetyl-CoA C-acetyltransferase